MSNQKISQLTGGNPAQSGDLIPIDRSGSNFSITAGSVAALAGASIHTATFTLTDAQLKALPTTTGSVGGLQAVAPVGVGNMILILGWSMILDQTAGAYTNVSSTFADGFALNNGAFGSTASSIILNSSLFTFGSRTISYGPMFGATDVKDQVTATAAFNQGNVDVPSDLDNGTLFIQSFNTGGNFTGGNAANSLKVRVFYLVIPTS